jgi:hypothetical protein
MQALPIELTNQFLNLFASAVPNSQADHAGIMAKFAIGCMTKMPKLVKRMEVQFGPGRLALFFEGSGSFHYSSKMI